MSDYMIGLCEAMESLTGADFDTLMQAMLDSTALTRWANDLPDPDKKRDMRKLYRQLQPYMD